ncbi:type-1 angiotensin II receptor-associated protein isoform X1 [Varanus komodoensis]|uniref:type-1 angiotensin II receptor-associated protein isoform X1 n=1 Tax=Varanus komodoensis TaxID=61221 RepID=UPI001CF77D5E|nr:type-1 angiotensin II receptor-associated protein isoform X1 [Varanus komodoensis]
MSEKMIPVAHAPFPRCQRMAKGAAGPSQGQIRMSSVSFLQRETYSAFLCMHTKYPVLNHPGSCETLCNIFINDCSTLLVQTVPASLRQGHHSAALVAYVMGLHGELVTQFLRLGKLHFTRTGRLGGCPERLHRCYSHGILQVGHDRSSYQPIDTPEPPRPYPDVASKAGPPRPY